MSPSDKLFYDRRDDELFTKRGMRNLYWLDDLGAIPLDEASPDDSGFLFAGARGIEDYTRLVARFPNMRDQPHERAPLLALDSVLDRIEARLEEQERSFRHVLTMLIEWLEDDTSREAA